MVERNISSGTVNGLNFGNGSVVNVFDVGVFNSGGVFAGGILNVSNGGQITNSLINSGTINVVSGGRISNLTVSSGGSLFMFEGADNYAERVSIHGPSLTSVSDGNLVSALVLADANVFITANGVANNTSITTSANVNVSDDAHIYNTTISGGTLNVFQNGQADNVSIRQGIEARWSGTVNAYDNATINSTTVQRGGNLNIYQSATASNNTVSENGIVRVFSGGSAFNTDMRGGLLVVSSGSTNYVENTTATYATISVTDGRLVDTILNAGGSLFVASNGIASNTTINNYSDIGVVAMNNGKVYATTINSGATLEVAASGYAYDTVINSNGNMYILSGGNVFDTTVHSGGGMQVNSGGHLSGIISIDNGGSATIWYGAGGSANLLGTNNTKLVITGLDNGGNPTTVIDITTAIDNFSGEIPGNSDSIVLQGINQSDVVNVDYRDAAGIYNPNFVTLTLESGSKITMNIIGAEAAGYNLSSQNGQLIYEVCFLTGSLIRTINGNVKVEDLQVGEELVTYDWKNNQEVIQNVKWIGYKNAVVNPELPDDMAGYPVRILKDAIAENIPFKDLLVTPEHCLFFDGKFVPARMLVNNYNIFYDYTITDYTYYHVETDTHSVVYADGMLTESYLDTGNRHTFFNPENNVILFPKQKIEKNWETDSCAPLVTDRNYIEELFNQIVLRAQNLNLQKRINDFILDDDPQLCIQTDNGQVIYPHAQNKGRVLFAIPSDIEAIHLISKSSRPSDAIGAYVDERRQLGVLIGDITLLNKNEAKTIDTHLSQNNLYGWHCIESHLYRWTDGNAYLPLGLQENGSSEELGYNILVIHIVAGGPYVSLIQEIKQIA